MASILKRPSGKWQAQVRINGKSISKTFTTRKDALSWSREIEANAERSHLPIDVNLLKGAELSDILTRYRDEVVSQKQAGRNEKFMIESILRDDAALWTCPAFVPPRVLV